MSVIFSGRSEWRLTDVLEPKKLLHRPPRNVVSISWKPNDRMLRIGRKDDPRLHRL